jgi:hypothetical protein
MIEKQELAERRLEGLFEGQTLKPRRITNSCFSQDFDTVEEFTAGSLRTTPALSSAHSH